MANTINYAKNYVPLLDESYRLAALSSDLESPSELVRAGANAKEIVVPKISMDGLGDYSRSNGYANGDASLTWETRTFNYDRGRMFSIDAMDDEETQGTAFGRLAGAFIKQKVAPEGDAFTFSKIASHAGIGSASADISTGEEALAALIVAKTEMDESEVPAQNRFLYITPTIHNLINGVDSYKSRAVLDSFFKIIDVPQTRFYTKVTLLDGSTDGQTAGGYVKTAATGKNLNFLIVHKDAVLVVNKHAVPKIILPDQNQDADAYKYGYRKYGLVDVFDNKVKGVYAHESTT